jgi:hemerythrin-like domain-containing protein
MPRAPARCRRTDRMGTWLADPAAPGALPGPTQRTFMANTTKSGASGGASSDDDTDDLNDGLTFDAIELLESDHREVQALFNEYESLVDSEGDDEDKQTLAEQICTLLTVHTTIEEEIFYPAARDALDEEDVDLLDEAVVEHASAKDLIEQIQSMTPGDELYDAKVKVLSEAIEHHVDEEESELFPKLRDSQLDLEELGEQMSARKEELLEV